MSAGFEQALALAAPVEGWLSEDQAQHLFERAAEVAPPGAIVEIGSYRGRSTIVLARAAGAGVTVVAIDPHAGNDRGPQQFEGTAEEGEADHRAFRAHLERAGVDDAVRHVRMPSQEALDEVTGPVGMLYVDGSHRYRPARDDIARWGSRVAPGGTLLVHDAFASVGVTLAVLRLLVAGRDFRYEGRTRSLAEYRREPLRGRERMASALRQLAQLPWFACNLSLKVWLLARGRTEPWPY